MGKVMENTKCFLNHHYEYNLTKTVNCDHYGTHTNKKKKNMKKSKIISLYMSQKLVNAAITSMQEQTIEANKTLLPIETPMDL